jgi:hypothetical protein
VEEFIRESFDLQAVGEQLRGRYRGQFGVAAEGGLGNGLGRGDAEEEGQQPACGEWQAERAWDGGEQAQEELRRDSVLEDSELWALLSVLYFAKNSRELVHSRTLSRGLERLL